MGNISLPLPSPCLPSSIPLPPTTAQTQLATVRSTSAHKLSTVFYFLLREFLAAALDVLTNISASNSSWKHLIIRTCVALSAPTRNTPASTLLSENLSGGFLSVPCFLRLLRVPRDRPNTSFKTKYPALLEDKYPDTKVYFPHQNQDIHVFIEEKEKKSL